MTEPASARKVVTLDTIERDARIATDTQLSARSTSIRIWSLFLISIVHPVIVVVQLLFIPVFGAILSLVGVTLWIKLLLALPKVRQKLAMFVGLLFTVTVVPVGRFFFPSISYSDLNVPFIYYMILAFCVSLSLITMFSLTHMLLKCRSHSFLD